MKILTVFLLLSGCAVMPAPSALGDGQASVVRHEAHGRARPLPPLVTPEDGGPVRGGLGGMEIYQPGKGWTRVRGEK